MARQACLVTERLRMGFLRRVARSSDADAYVLRGGLRLRQLVPITRRVGDVDLVCTQPWNLELAKHALRRMLSDSANDEVIFHRSRFDVYSAASVRPGVRLYAQGSVAGERADLVVDVVFNLELYPAPEWVSMHDFRLRMIAGSTIVATKLRVLAELDRAWRAKDLSDALLLLRAHNLCNLGEAMEHAWTQGDVDPREMIAHPSWWNTGSARWNAWRINEPNMPTLESAVDELRHHLAPFWRRR